MRGRRIVFDNVSGEIIVDIGESSGMVIPFPVINSLDYIDLEYGFKADKFQRVKKYHVDIETKEIIFDELYPVQVNQDDYIQQLENELLVARGVI